MAKVFLPTRIEEIQQRVQMFAAATILWNEHLSLADRQTLGGELEAAWRRDGGCTTGMWRALHRTSEFEAVVDLAELLELISAAEATRWRSNSGFSQQKNDHKPSWDGQMRELWYRGRRIRKVVRADAVNVIAILAAFQAKKWPQKIADPLPGLTYPVKLAASVNSVNKGLDAIKFHTDGGCEVYWEPLAL